MNAGVIYFIVIHEGVEPCTEWYVYTHSDARELLLGISGICCETEKQGELLYVIKRRNNADYCMS